MPDVRNELGAFLRAAREQLVPAAFGLPTTSRRRTPGLRREEVAAASGVGVAWYTWLEQGRVTTSRQVLDSLARTLRLGCEQHRHLLSLGGYSVDGSPHETVLSELRPLLDSWPLTPALLLNHRFEVLAGNTAFATVWPEPVLPTSPERGANLLVSLATSPVLREMLVPEERVAYEVFLRFRARADRWPSDPGVQRVLDELHALRPDLDHWWKCRAIRELGTWPVTVIAESGTSLRFTFSLLQPGGDPATTLLVQAPVDTATREWMRRHGTS